MYNSYKPKRIKRKSIYNNKHRRKGPLFFAALILGACLVVFLGYSIQEPLELLLSGKFSMSSSLPSSQPLTSSTSSNNLNTSSKLPASSLISSNIASTNLRGIFLSQSYLLDSASLDKVIASSKSVNINLAVVELKGENGKVAYNSKVAAAQGSGIVASGAPEGTITAQKLSAAGITPAAKISCFKDPVAPVFMFNAAVLYSGDHSIRWLDSNGNRWLNPYSDKAQQYIIDLAKEAVSMGYKQIFLDNVEFPVGTNQAWLGDNMPSREDALKAFVAKVTQEVQAVGGKVSVIMPGNAAIGQIDPLSGQNQSIYSFNADYLSPNICPSLFFKASVTIGSTVITKPDQTPGDTVSAAAQFLKQQSGAKITSTLPFIQAFTNTGLGDGFFKQYTSADINAEITALKNAGINNFVLYSPQGVYDFGGVNAQ